MCMKKGRYGSETAYRTLFTHKVKLKGRFRLPRNFLSLILTFLRLAQSQNAQSLTSSSPILSCCSSCLRMSISEKNELSIVRWSLAKFALTPGLIISIWTPRLFDSPANRSNRATVIDSIIKVPPDCVNLRMYIPCTWNNRFIFSALCASPSLTWQKNTLSTGSCNIITTYAINPSTATSTFLF